MQRRYAEPPESRGRVWAWPLLALPIGLLLAAGVLRTAYLRTWTSFVLLLVLFWPAWVLINLPHYRAWRAHRLSGGSFFGRARSRQ